MLMLCFVLCPLSFACAAWGDAADDDEPPVARQPADFDGAVGGYRIRTQAKPTTVQAEDPLLFTVLITGSGPAGHLPRRPDLRRLPLFKRQFAIEDVPDRDRYVAGEHTWQFSYRLRPRSLDPPVKAIPAVPFVYYKPHLIDPERGYQTDYSRPIPLKVLPRAVVTKPEAPPVQLPARLYELVEGSQVLRHERPSAPPGLTGILLLLLAPPALCAGWYVTWRRLYPDAARLTRRRRSRAARQALGALETAGRDDRAPEKAAAITALYLRQRVDLSAAEPTPAEVAGHLEGAGFPAVLGARVAEFFRECDAARFGPGPLRGGTDFPAAAAELILALEEHHEPRE